MKQLTDYEINLKEFSIKNSSFDSDAACQALVRFIDMTQSLAYLDLRNQIGRRVIHVEVSDENEKTRG